MFNNQGPKDVRNVLTGKDGALFNDAGAMLATVETFKTEIAVTNTGYQPLGDAQEHDVFQSYKVSLTFSQVIIENDDFIKDLYKAMETGIMPSWNFQGVVKGRNGSQERGVYRQCVPQGNIDLQNLEIGQTLKRNWSLTVNEPPKLQSLLTV